MNKTREFLELVKQNPDLPIVPMVDSEIVADDGYAWWLGSFACASVGEYVSIKMRGELRFFTKDEQDEIEEFFADNLADERDYDLHEREIEKLAHEQAENLPWVKAIIVYIKLPEV